MKVKKQLAARNKPMNIFAQIATRIIREQESIIGPLAWNEALKVAGLNVNDKTSGEVSLNGNPGEVLDKLVARYEHLFGAASREICKDAAVSLTADLPLAEIPSSLR